MSLFSHIFAWRRSPTDHARALAQIGAEKRRGDWKAKRNARIRQLCEEMGKPFPDVLA